MIGWESEPSGEDMVVAECVTLANEGGRRGGDGCYREVLRDCVFQLGYGLL